MSKADAYFKGKNAIITGGSSGIGQAAAELLARLGANIFIIARNEQNNRQAVEEIRACGSDPEQQCGNVSADVGKYEEVEAAVATIVAAAGPPDILINSAGIARPGYVEELPLSAFKAQMDTNFFGTLHTVKAVLPHMMAQRKGHIVNISSIGGALGLFGYTGYGASKFAVLGFSESLRIELKPHNIAVSLVLPADTETPQLWEERKRQPLETKMTTGIVTPEKLHRPSEFIAYGFVKLIGGGSTMSPHQVAEAMLKGIRRRKYLVIPDLSLKAAYYLRGFLVPVANWAFDQLIPVARKERGTQ